MSTLQVLVVDDEAAIRQVIGAQLRKAGHEVELASSGEEAVSRLMAGDVDVVVCDLRLPDLGGVEILRRVRAAGVESVFLMITAYASVNNAIEAMKAGAFDYLIKPVRPEDLIHRLGQIAEMIGLQDENRRLKSLVREGAPAERCTLPSTAMRLVDAQIAKVARTDGTVFITGESGTGKGMLARSIHQLSRRRDEVFISVNCGAIPENLLESEFFGHLKGAFTGADRAKKGLFLEADRGTLFLDEICELPLALQVKLLHVLEDQEFRPVGAAKARRVDVRIIAATNRNVDEMVARGAFREDLYYRLNVFHVDLPPLRTRREDILPLMQFLLGREARRLGIDGEVGIEPEAAEVLMGHEWPGNIREMQNVVARALILADGRPIAVDDLPPQVLQAGGGTPPVPRGESPLPVGTLRERVRSYEIGLIRRAIEESRGDRQQAARRLGIGLSTLYRKLEEAVHGGDAEAH
jgi:two-component system response regulator AtoC